MTVVSSLDASNPQTPVQREILMALFTPLGKCRFMEEKVNLLSQLVLYIYEADWTLRAIL